MKKRWKLILLIVVLAGLAIGMLTVQGAYTPEKVTAFTVSGDAQMLSPRRVEDSKLVEAFNQLLIQSSKAASPEDAGELARFQTETKEGSGTLYRVLSDESKLFLQFWGNCRQISTEAYGALWEALGTDFYLNRPIPKAVADYEESRQELMPLESTYSYLRPDGKYCRTAFTPAESTPSFVLEGKAAFPKIELSLEPQSAAVRIALAGKTVFEGPLAQAGDFQPEASGRYLAQITAVYDSTYYRGEVVWPLELEYTLPVTFEVAGSDTYPGELAILRAYNVPKGQSVTASTNLNFTPTFFDRGDGTHVALLPVSCFTQKGEYSLTLSSGDVSGTYSIRAQNKEFHVQQLTVSASTAEQTILSQKANAEYARIINPLKEVRDAEAYWEGRFILPVQGGKITTPFGTIRYTNGSKEGSVHGAADIALPVGTRVGATNNGRVLYAGYLQLTGNTVLIEHGYGLKSWYYHMNSLAVSTGDMVTTGQKIGEVGSTGFSTGPHLHFGVTVNNVSINPYTAIETDLLAWN
ncbi:M23 family metallopeptidase [Oscillospiraceae bacterium MB08-C2-2]|nr:M23 family metallopeptidase [Oscillospiraceae bacterium MB08-C2-2]